MANKLSCVFSTTTAKDTPPSMTGSVSDDYIIPARATITDDTGNPVSGKKLQIYTSPPTLNVWDANGESVPTDPNSQGYEISDDGEGNYSFSFTATIKTISRVSLVIDGDPDSTIDNNQQTLVFSSYVNTTTKYGPPVIPDDNGVLDLGNGVPYVDILLPSSTHDYVQYSDAMTALLVNGDSSIVGSFSDIYNSGFRVPTNMLIAEKTNQFGYIIVNGANSVAPITAWTTVIGEILLKPPYSKFRTSKQSPYLPSHAAAVNNASVDLSVYIDIPESNPDNINPDDIFSITVYIDAYHQGTYQANNNIFSLADITVRPADIENKRITATIDKSKLQSYGMNASGQPGSIYIDYTLKRAVGSTDPLMPEYYYSGVINTVGPI